MTQGAPLLRTPSAQLDELESSDRIHGIDGRRRSASDCGYHSSIEGTPVTWLRWYALGRSIHDGQNSMQVLRILSESRRSVGHPRAQTALLGVYPVFDEAALSAMQGKAGTWVEDYC